MRPQDYVIIFLLVFLFLGLFYLGSVLSEVQVSVAETKTLVANDRSNLETLVSRLVLENQSNNVKIANIKDSTDAANTRLLNLQSSLDRVETKVDQINTRINNSSSGGSSQTDNLVQRIKDDTSFLVQYAEQIYDDTQAIKTSQLNQESTLNQVNTAVFNVQSSLANVSSIPLVVSTYIMSSEDNLKRYMDTNKTDSDAKLIDFGTNLSRIADSTETANFNLVQAFNSIENLTTYSRNAFPPLQSKVDSIFELVNGSSPGSGGSTGGGLSNVAALSTQIDTVYRVLRDSVNSGFTSVNGSFTTLTNTIGTRFDSVDGKLSTLQTSVDSIKTNVDIFKPQIERTDNNATYLRDNFNRLDQLATSAQVVQARDQIIQIIEILIRAIENQPANREVIALDP